MLFLFYTNSISSTTSILKEIYITKMSSIINNMSIRQNIASGLAVEKVGVNNLDLYIPRVSDHFTEEQIKYIFANMGIGMVSYVDFVATKDPETKQHKYYSAFVRLSEWNPNGYWHNLIMVEKQNKIQISVSEFWIVLSAKTPLSRSKVNTHQLAAYTDELYVRVEAIEKSAVENITVSSTHFKNLLAKSEAQAAQIDQLLKIVAEQSNQLSVINKLLFEEQQPVSRERTLTIEDLASEDIDTEEWSPSVCEICGDEFDEEKQLGFHSTVCKPKEEPKPEEKPIVYCDDECFFLKPLVVTDTTTKKQKKADIMSGSFSFDLEDVLGPVAKSMGITKEEARKGIEKEWADSQRAQSSRNFCGNS
jgi:hypothetical protein